MPVKDLHELPFSEETITKLEIFEDYLDAWIPTFVMSGFEDIYIYDFFAGQGYDIVGVAGSPIRILECIKKHLGNILSHKTKVHLLLNEYDHQKYSLLCKSVDDFFNDNPRFKYFIEVNLYNEKFEDLFPKKERELKIGPNLVFLDQNGIKQFSDNTFLKFIEFDKTDFLTFISSSYFRRFANDEGFQKHIAVDVEEINKNPYKYIHEVILNHFKGLIPSGNDIKLYPFSLKKEKNIYGLIFGAKHIRAVDKFLTVAWKKNTINGTANFDIDGDVPEKTNQISLNFKEFKKQTKIEAFNKDLRELILNNEVTNLDVYIYTLEKGFTAKHAVEVVRQLKEEKLITFKGQPKINYENYKTQSVLRYEKN